MMAVQAETNAYRPYFALSPNGYTKTDIFQFGSTKSESGEQSPHYKELPVLKTKPWASGLVRRKVKAVNSHRTTGSCPYRKRSRGLPVWFDEK